MVNYENLPRLFLYIVVKNMDFKKIKKKQKNRKNVS